MKTLLIGIMALALPAGAASLRGEDVAALYAAHCASCHGKDGAGHTKVGHLTGVKDLTNAAYLKAYSDEQMFADLKNGLEKDGRTRMRPFADKLTDAQIKALVTYCRSLGR